MGSLIFVIFSSIFVVAVIVIIMWNKGSNPKSNMTYDQVMQEAKQNDDELLSLISDEEDEEEEDI